MRALLFIAIALAPSVAAADPPAQVYESDLPLDHPAIPYWGPAFDDPVASLVREVRSGTRGLEPSPDRLAFLGRLLDALGVHPESQTLVFAQNSLQKSKISPRTPRAIYFGDDVMVGYVPGSDVIELAGVDPVRGAAFYTLTIGEDAVEFDQPRLCMACHRAAATLGVPGIYVSSVAVTPSGRPQFSLGTVVSDHRTPFAERWGGWYVDGAPAEVAHRGNRASATPGEGIELLDDGGRALVSLSRTLGRDAYLEPTSDAVALSTLEHQTLATNLITRLGWEARIAEHAGESPDVLAPRIRELARYLVFADEAPLEAPLERSRFTAAFESAGRRDREGRSLRDFDLRERLFRYPLSYTIETAQFDALPAGVRERVLRQIYDALRSEEGPADSNARRDAIELFRRTRPDAPGFWR